MEVATARRGALALIDSWPLERFLATGTILGRSNAPRGTGTRPQDEPNPRVANSRRERRVLATLVCGSVRRLLRRL